MVKVVHKLKNALHLNEKEKNTIYWKLLDSNQYSNNWNWFNFKQVSSYLIILFLIQSYFIVKYKYSFNSLISLAPLTLYVCHSFYLKLFVHFTIFYCQFKLSSFIDIHLLRLFVTFLLSLLSLIHLFNDYNFWYLIDYLNCKN